jgi:predicted dehydrogenase/threonine dehydrogenase-like Zn-dependent dehydrogenase
MVSMAVVVRDVTSRRPARNSKLMVSDYCLSSRLSRSLERGADLKQVAQRPRDGRISVVEAPLPVLRPGWVLVANRFSLISAGTERSKLELGSKSLFGKARARPDLARKVVDKARVEGVRSALSAARERLDALAPLGYSSAGVVLEVGAAVEGLSPGDHVACAGGGWANHAEVVAVPRNLMARVPDGVELSDAAYATVGAIALHGVRQADARLGEHVGVIGLGLVGQVAMRLLVTAGAVPMGVDLDDAAVELARSSGALAFRRDEPGLEQGVIEATRGLGLDAILICAATSSLDPVALAARLARDRGRLVIVGDVPVEADRALLYEKELDLRLSRSYGPGRYDRDYEEHGRDLPAGYVRWTEQRNLQAFVDLLASRRLDLTGLTSHRYPIERAEEAYAALMSGGGERSFGVLLEYHYEQPLEPTPFRSTTRRSTGSVRIGLIGAGAFARGTLLPALREENAELAAVATEGGLSAADVADRFGFERTAASTDEILSDDSINAVVIATRHGSHAALAAQALRAGKAVFVEKPLALGTEELEEIEDALPLGGPLMVGFNRRFAPLTERLLQELHGIGQLALLVRVNAGPLPADHWLHDPELGGGRLLGEGCHFIDLLSHVAQARVTSVHSVASPIADRSLECSDNFVASLSFAGGSVGTLLYSGAGDPRLPKERLEAFGGDVAAVLDDFRRLVLFRGGKRTLVKSKQDKGHSAEIARFVAAVRGVAEAPAPEGYFASTRATLALAESLRTGLPVQL